MNQSSKIFKAHDPGDMFALLPALFGFKPAESLIVITTHGERHRIGFSLRVDLPNSDKVVDAALAAATHVQAHRPDGVLLLAISSTPEPAGALVDVLRDILHDLPVLEAARADGERYWSYLCDVESCCPAEGRVYGDRSSEVVAQAILDGDEILPNREALVRRFAPITGSARNASDHATEQVVSERLRSPDGSEHLARGMAQVTSIVDRLLGKRRHPNAAEAAIFTVWVAEISIRDELWIRIDRADAKDWLRFLTKMAQRAVPPFEPAVLSLAAFAAWMSGDGAQASIALDRALQSDPDYSLAQLLGSVLESGISPERWPAFESGEDLAS